MIDTKLYELIKRAAKSASFQWPGIVEEDDMTQDICIRLLESPETIDKLATMEEGVQLSWLKKIGHQIASKERTDYEHFSGNFRYSVGEVKALLSAGVLDDLGELLKSSWSAEDYIAKGGGFEDAVLAKNSMETDLRRGLHALASTNSSYYAAVHRRYIGGEMEVDRNALNRALESLTDHMNRSFKRQFEERPDGLGSRKVISNASARVLSSKQYDDDPKEKGAWDV